MIINVFGMAPIDALNTHADPDGDVTFHLGTSTDTRILKVSSKVLSLASTVFAALLRPPFAEGNALSNTQSSCQIPLPDDDPEGMTVIFYALHHHHQATPNAISFELLENIVVLCDKYSLVTALTSWVDVWSRQWRLNGDGEVHWSKLLCIGYLFLHHHTFHLNTQKLLSSCICQTSLVERSLISRFTTGRPRACPTESLETMVEPLYSIANVPYRVFGKCLTCRLWSVSHS